MAVYSGDANNNAVTSPCGAGSESVVVTKPKPTIVTVASLSGGSISDTATLGGLPAGGPAPTGAVTFNIYGPNDANCSGAPISSSTIALTGAGTSATSPAFKPTAPGVYRFTASYSGDVNSAANATACNDANESVTLPSPVISVTKTAAPPSKVEPGGTFTFTVTVSNPSPNDAIKITSLNDSIYGNLATLAGSTCGALIGTTLAPGATSAPCTFPGPFAGTAGQSQTDTVTVNGVDISGFTATATANATVTLTPLAPPPPVIAVTKAAAPATLPEPGGTFTFTVSVSNPSTTTPVKITSLVDNIYGDLATRPGSTCGGLIGTTLAPGGSTAPCSFTGPFSGKAGDKQTDTVTVTGVQNGITVMATANATVGLTPAGPQIAVTKAASPSSLPAPGGTFTFTATVTNPSTLQPVTITQLVDNIYGDLATRPGSTCSGLIGVVLAPGATSAPCSFTGPFNGNSGDKQTDVITVTGMNNGTTVTATAQATVTLSPAPAPPPAITPAPASVATVTFHAPAACVATPFKVFVSGLSIARVTYYVDGRRLPRVNQADSQGHFSVTIKTAGLAKGKLHHLTAVIEPVAHSGQPVRTVRRTFAVCATPSLPRFTG